MAETVHPGDVPLTEGDAGRRDELFETLSTLVALHSPSGRESAVDEYLTERLRVHGEPVSDPAGISEQARTI